MTSTLPTPIQNIYNTIYNNAIRFLKRAIRELTAHHKESLDEDQALMSCLFIQLANELAMKAYIIQNHSIKVLLSKNKDRTKTPEELYAMFQAGELHTVQFWQIRDYLTDNNTIFNEEQLEHIKLFQEHRNKLVHLHLELAPGDLFDLKFQLIYVIVHVITPLLAEIHPSYETPSEFYQGELDRDDYLQLVKFPAYVKEMEDLATGHSAHVYYCPECSEKTFSVDHEICYCCNLNYIGAAGLSNCPSCEANRSVAYDQLNIALNGHIAQGLCLNCGAKPVVFQCPECETAEAFYDVLDLKKACFDKCQMSDD